MNLDNSNGMRQTSKLKSAASFDASYNYCEIYTVELNYSLLLISMSYLENNLLSYESVHQFLVTLNFVLDGMFST